MTAEELVKSGDLDAALQELQQKVRTNPADAKLRIFLFQLLSLLGQWKRALTQLEVIHDLDSEAWPLVHTYREVINCELHRDAVFQGLSKPIIFGDPSDWLAFLVEAQQAHARNDLASFRALNAKALELAPPSRGKINGEAFEWLADADQRFGPVIEMVFNGQYYWVPINTIRVLRTEPPADLRDLAWLPAQITWANEGQTVAMLPSRYPLTGSEDGPHLLSRKTHWMDRGDELFDGFGQRMFATDQSDYPLLEVRSIEVDR